MEARLVDERELTAEIEAFTIRVDFWEAATSTLEAWMLSDAQIGEALAWAQQHAQGRGYSLLVCIDVDDRLVGIRVEGSEPSQGGWGLATPGWFTVVDDRSDEGTG